MRLYKAFSILNEMPKYIRFCWDKGVENGRAEGIAEGIEEGTVLQALKDNNILSGKELEKYMQLNKSHSSNIGTLKIMERADDKYTLINEGLRSISEDLKRFGEAGRDNLVFCKIQISKYKF